MRVFVAVLALFALACQQTPRYKLETRAGQTLRVDTQTGETARLENGAWVAVGTGSAVPESQGLPDADLANIRVSAVQTSAWDMHITIENGTAWNLTGVEAMVNDWAIPAPIKYGKPLRPGERWSFTANRMQQNSPLIGAKLTTEVLSAEGHR